MKGLSDDITTMALVNVEILVRKYRFFLRAHKRRTAEV
jgi:hypothetical protein